MKIEVDTIKEMTEIVYDLVTKGLTFNVHKTNSGKWIIALLGGY